MFTLSHRIRKIRFWLVLRLILIGSLSNACISSQRTMARNKVNLWADVLKPPTNAELLLEDIGVTRRDRNGCWAAYVDRVYGTDDLTLAVINHYDQSLKSSQGWVKNSIIVGDDIAVYDHPDGSSVEISTDIDLDFPSQFEKHQTSYRTLFFVVIISRPPDIRDRCREY
jgi:hypothetical protein